MGDFAIAIYNPSSHKRKDYLKRACDILLEILEEDRACGYVENIGREGTKAVVCTLKELRDTQVNMSHNRVYRECRMGNHQWKTDYEAGVSS